MPDYNLPSDTDLFQIIKKLEERVIKLERSPRAEATEIGAGGITVKGGSIVVQDNLGDAQARLGPLTAGGYGLEVFRDSEWVPASNFSVAQFVYDANGTTNFSIPGTPTTRASFDVVVPAGYTQAQVVYVVELQLINGSGSAGFVGVGPQYDRSDDVGAINQMGLPYTEWDIPDGADRDVSVTRVALITGLTGGVTLTFRTTLDAGFGTWPLDSNRIFTYAVITFLP